MKYCGRFVVEFLPSEKQGMARVVCDELARQAYTSPTDVFVKRLLQLRELSEDWMQIDGVKNSLSEAGDGNQSIVHEGVMSGNDMSDNDDNDMCDVSMVCDEIPSTSDYMGQERRPRPISRMSDQRSTCALYFSLENQFLMCCSDVLLKPVNSVVANK